MCLAGNTDFAHAPAKGVSSADATRAMQMWFDEMLKNAVGVEKQQNAVGVEKPQVFVDDHRGSENKQDVNLSPSSFSPSQEPDLRASKQSEPAVEDATQTSPADMQALLGLLGQSETAPLLMKTRMCKFFARGQCTRGSACSFAHNSTELQKQPDLYRTQLCISFLNAGTCNYGASCKYAHSVAELQPVHQGRAVKKNAQEQKRLQAQLQQVLRQTSAKASETSRRQASKTLSKTQSAASMLSARAASTLSVGSSATTGARSSDLTCSTCGSDVDLSDLSDLSEKISFYFLEDGSSMPSEASTDSEEQLPQMQWTYSDPSDYVCAMKNTFLEFVPAVAPPALQRSKSSPSILGA